MIMRQDGELDLKVQRAVCPGVDQVARPHDICADGSNFILGQGDFEAFPVSIAGILRIVDVFRLDASQRRRRIELVRLATIVAAVWAKST